jgi:hypothetical protein
MSPTRRTNLTSDRVTHVSSHVGLAACCGGRGNRQGEDEGDLHVHEHVDEAC